MAAIKAKTYSIPFAGQQFLVMGLTKAGSAKNLIEHIVGTLEPVLATGEQLYEAGKSGAAIIAEDHYKRAVDPSPIDMPGLGDTPAAASTPINQADEE